MMMIFKKAIPRRTFLRGVGATVALPLLDGMIPAFASVSDNAAGKPPVRLSMIYVPNGRIMEKWIPKTVGTGFEMTPILEPLAPFRDHLIVLSGLSSANGGGHDAASAAFLTGVRGKNGQLGVSADQVAAKELSKHTQLASLEVSIDGVGLLGGGDSPTTDAYTNTIAWRSATTPLPTESNPRAVFERLFGEGGSTDPAERLARMRKNRSILDFVAQDVASALWGVGPGDRTKLTEYLDGIRDVERRIQKAEEQISSSSDFPVMERPAGAPARYDDQAKLMFDLQVLAYQSDLTRVITFVMSKEKSERAYREIGIHEGHHALSHHQRDREMMAKVAQIDTFQSKLLAYFLEKLRSTPDGDGSLLDHSVILYGSGLGDGNLHLSNNLPILLAGGGAGRMKGGRHIKYPLDTPLTNLHLTMLDIAGVAVDKLGDSTGKLELLSVS